MNDLERREAVRNLFSDDFSDEEDFAIGADGTLAVPPPYAPAQRYIPGLDARPPAPPTPPSTVPRRYLLSLRSALAFCCQHCGYGTSIPVTLPGAYTELGPLNSSTPETKGAWLVPLHAEACENVQGTPIAPSRTCPFDKLPEDIWFEILQHLSSTSDVLILSKAWPPLSALVASSNLIAKREIRCCTLCLACLPHDLTTTIMVCCSLSQEVSCRDTAGRWRWMEHCTTRADFVVRLPQPRGIRGLASSSGCPP